MTITRSISIDRETDRFLRESAAAHFDGNVSTLIIALAKDAESRAAAGAFLDRCNYTRMTDEEAESFIVKHTQKKSRRRAA